MTVSIHDKLQKLDADIAALELKQQKLKEHITQRMMFILEQEQAFTIDPPLLLGSIAEAIRNVHNIHTSNEKDHLNQKTKLTEIGQAYLKKRILRRPQTHKEDTTS